MKKIGLGLLCVLTHGIFSWAFASNAANNNDSCYPFVYNSHQSTIEEPVAVNDTFILGIGCGNNTISGNLLSNDTYIQDSFWLSEIDAPAFGNFSCGPRGQFTFSSPSDFRGNITLTYRLRHIVNSTIYSEAQLTIIVDADNDCDQIINSIDMDDDNDGILDVHEGDGMTDTDADGIPDCLDIDSDNDGITDFEEWQTEGFCKSLLFCDNNKDGWDDAFDPAEGGDYYEQIDTDMDGIPDFRDIDSDNDGISDHIEAFDVNNDKVPEINFSNMDFDSDGLDNSCDTVDCGSSKLNPMGSSSPLPDNDTNNIRDWRDPYNYIVVDDQPFAKTGENELLVYPNPVVDECTVVLPTNDNSLASTYSLKLFDMKGSLVHLELFEAKEKRLSLKHLEKGMYIVRVTMGSKRLVTRISKVD